MSIFVYYKYLLKFLKILLCLCQILGYTWHLFFLGVPLLMGYLLCQVFMWMCSLFLRDTVVCVLQGRDSVSSTYCRLFPLGLFSFLLAV